MRKTAVYLSTAALAILAIGAASLYFYANYRARVMVDERLAALVASGRYDALSYESLHIAANGVVRLENFRMEQDGSTAIIQEIRINDFDYAHAQPWHMDLEITGFQFPDGLDSYTESVDPTTAALFSDLLQGDTLPLHLHYRYDYQPAERERIDATLRATLPNAFDLALDTTTRAIPLSMLIDPALADPDPLVAMSRLSSIMAQGELPITTLMLTDYGVVDRVITQGSGTYRMSVEDYRQQLITQARNFYLFLPQNVQAAAMQAGAQVATFLEGGHTLLVKLEPEFEGRLAQLQPQLMGAVFTGDFNQVVDLLNLQIETVKP